MRKIESSDFLGMTGKNWEGLGRVGKCLFTNKKSGPQWTRYLFVHDRCQFYVGCLEEVYAQSSMAINCCQCVCFEYAHESNDRGLPFFFCFVFSMKHIFCWDDDCFGTSQAVAIEILNEPEAIIYCFFSLLADTLTATIIHW